MDKDALLTRLRKRGPVDFVDCCLFDEFAWYFPTATRRHYDDLRATLGSVFKVAPDHIAVVGSAKYGFSLAPEKNFAAFNPESSDLDLVVVSRGLFRSTWKNLRTAHYNGAINAKNIYQGDIFRRFIMLGSDDFHETHYLRDLMKLLGRFRRAATSELGIEQTAKLRIYETWSDAKTYHVWSLQKLGARHGIQ